MKVARANRARRTWGGKKAKAYKRGCNLCKHEFIARSPFDRFCGTCKSEKDLFRFAEWLPNLPLAV